MSKKQSSKWFKRVRGSYLPNTWQGWLTYIPFTSFLVSVLIIAITTQRTVISAVFMIFPQWVAAAVVMMYVASKNS